MKSMKLAGWMVPAMALLLAACGGQSADEAAVEAPVVEEETTQMLDAPPPPPEALAPPSSQFEAGGEGDSRPAEVRVLTRLMPTAGHSAGGDVVLQGSADGIHITGRLEGVEPNRSYAFHIHEIGDCSAEDGSSAGPHFNPHDQPHGEPGSGASHAGDMLNLEADENGLLRVDRWATGATLGDGSETDAMGRALILHAGPDDYSSQPAGDAGARIACGVINDAELPR